MPKIKILFGITKGNWGGAQKYVYDLATNLPAEKFAVSVVSGAPGVLVEKLEAQNIPVFRLATLQRDINPLRDLSSFFKLLKLLRQERPDILHLNSPKMGLLGALAGHLAGVKKIIYTSHGWPFFEQRSPVSKLFFRILCWKITWLCHEVIVISKSEKTKAKFNLIYNGIAPINFLPQTEARKKLNLSEIGFVVGTIAELHKNKGLEYLPANFSFVIIGEGEERETLAKNKNLILLGNMPNAATLLPAFDIFVLPSIKEGLPYVILEAGLAGLPVVATRVGGIPEIITTGLNGLLVPPKNPEQLAQAINYLLQNPEQRKVFGQNLRQKVQTDFSLDQMVTKTMAVYEK